ncbi:MAG: type II toxin-antitoxin system RelE/ParE family toxin [Candidatus Micrarchaeota archaeon]|nr:type II toxin-antitoxin system RelE/ParE family toxin [Candidatus Micrarchaeota archaeon]
MPYTLIWAPTAQHALSSLQKEVSARIVKKANQILDNPHPFLERMVEYKIYKLRVGDYRVFIDIDEEKKELHAVNVKHRKNAYK